MTSSTRPQKPAVKPTPRHPARDSQKVKEARQTVSAFSSRDSSRSYGRWVVSLILLLALIGGAWWLLSSRNQPQVPVGRVQIVNEYPHDPGAFCQGLVYQDGFLYEGTGQYGKSQLRKVDLERGKPLQVHKLNERLFGEGITILEDRIVQLTWKAQLGIVYDQATLKQVSRFGYWGEGWGLTHDGTHLIMSNGSSVLQFLNPKDMKVVRRLRVTNRNRPVDSLNELEYIGGEIWANIWKSDFIARISPKTGQLLGVIDLSPIAKKHAREGVLNGIAFDAEKNRIFITGKNWSKLYQIQLATADK